MLTKKQINEIREHLNKSQNPIFLFDNDQDGLCSFLLLRKYLGRGKGVPIKSFPGLNKDYFRKINEFGSDYIFILDKPVVCNDFFTECEQKNIPVVWIDHHEIEKENIPYFVNYYNPLFNRGKKNEPVSFLCYQIIEKKELQWISIVGSISDNFIPNFYNGFRRKYPDLTIKTKNPFDVYYKSEIGKIAKIFGFGLKDRTTNVMNMIRFLINAKSPYDVFEENKNNRSMHNRFKQINSKYLYLLKKAKILEKQENKLIFFQYGGDLSISSDISNELVYSFPKKIIVVLYLNGAKANISMRGKNSRRIFLKTIEGIEGAKGGGHENAVGGQINVDDVEVFRKNLNKVILDF